MKFCESERFLLNQRGLIQIDSHVFIYLYTSIFEVGGGDDLDDDNKN